MKNDEEMLMSNLEVPVLYTMHIRLLLFVTSVKRNEKQFIRHMSIIRKQKSEMTRHLVSKNIAVSVGLRIYDDDGMI